MVRKYAQWCKKVQMKTVLHILKKNNFMELLICIGLILFKILEKTFSMLSQSVLIYGNFSSY